MHIRPGPIPIAHTLVGGMWLDPGRLMGTSLPVTRSEMSFLIRFLLFNFTGVRRFFCFLHSSHGKIFTFERRLCILECVFSYLSF